MHSTVAELKSEGYDIRTLNVGTNPQTAQEYNVRGVPTFVLVVDGEAVRRITGPTSQDKLRGLFHQSRSWF
jgi:thioredoxin-like negative regulator of GroEL